jgi:hypothetical protein
MISEHPATREVEQDPAIKTSTCYSISTVGYPYSATKLCSEHFSYSRDDQVTIQISGTDTMSIQEKHFFIFQKSQTDQ